VVRIPFTLSAEAKGAVEVGANVTWSACDEAQCYAAENETVSVAVHRGSDAAGPVPAPPATGTPSPVTNGSAPDVPGMMPAPSPSPAPTPPAAASPPTSVTLRGVAATGTVTFHPDRVDVEIVPAEGFHLYPVGHEGGTGSAIEVGGRPGPGIHWKDPVLPLAGDEVTEPYAVRLPYVREGEGAAVRVFVKWQGCDEAKCHAPEDFAVVSDERGARLETAAPTASAAPGRENGLLFPEVGRTAGEATASVAREESWIEQYWKQLGILFLGPIFLFGLLLAFTPCVLPIIPITVSIIGGGRTDLTKGRLTFLLTCYALGLSTAYGVLGLMAAMGGASLSAAFESDVALYVIAGVFFLLSLGMFGIYELQPPAWLQRIQGGAKGGSVLGSFVFGAMAAVIASPCTGPAIVAMVVFVATTGNALLGFLMFFTLGLGMSSVFFAAGSLNLLMRPGPWMVWVRWFFGILLVGAAFYYLTSSEKLVGTALTVVGVLVAAGIAFGTWHHLAKKEMDDKAVRKAAVLAGVLAATIAFVAFLTRPGDLAWTDLRDRAHLVAAVERAKEEGKVTVVDVWAPWCTYCRKYDHVIEGDAELKAAFRNMNRLRIRVDSDARLDLRGGVGIKEGQPILVFIDAQGRIHREHDIEGWIKGPAEGLRSRVKDLGVPTAK
jgi:thiol:disulfide interchange protein DsbD